MSSIGLNVPSAGSESWDVPVNENWTKLEKLLGAVRYIGDNTRFASVGDIGAQANAAYADLPSPGGKIIIIPKENGALYNFSTPIVFGTLGKYVLLEWGGASGIIGTSGYQNGINYTPTSGVAIKLDYATGTGIPAMSAHGIRRLLIVNNGVATFGGGPGTAVAIDSGLTNAGDSEAFYDNISIAGFPVGYRNLGTSSHFGVVFLNPNFYYNGSGCLLHSPSPIQFLFGTYAGNTAVLKTNATTSSPGIWMNFPDCFNNTCILDATPTVGLANCGHFHGSLCHFEASTAAQTPFIKGVIDVMILGGAAEIDVTGGTSASFFNMSGYFFEADMEFFSAAATTTILAATEGYLRGKLAGIFFGSNFAAFVTGAAAARIEIDLHGAGANSNVRSIADKPTVTGSRNGNAALASLCTALADLGLITNSTS